MLLLDSLVPQILCVSWNPTYIYRCNLSSALYTVYEHTKLTVTKDLCFTKMFSNKVLVVCMSPHGTRYSLSFLLFPPFYTC